MNPTISRVTVRGKLCWMLSFKPAGKPRKRRFFDSQAKAKSERDSLLIQAMESGQIWATMDARERVEVCGVLREMRERGTNLPEVWKAWKASATMQPVYGKRLSVVIAECLDAKLGAGRKARYVQDLRYFLERFANGRGAVEIASIGVSDLDTWLGQVAPASPWSRRTWINRLGTLFSFAVRRGYIQGNPCERLELPAIVRSAPKILSVDQCKTLLSQIAVDAPLALPWVILGLFCGLRPEEADKIGWASIDLARGILTVDAAASKTSDRRIVHLTDQAVVWLRHVQGCPLPVSRSTRRRAQRGSLAAIGEPAWPKDVLRHSAASYLAAHWGDSRRVTEELGHSIYVFLNHYRELVSKEDADAWSKILLPSIET